MPSNGMAEGEEDRSVEETDACFIVRDVNGQAQT